MSKNIIFMDLISCIKGHRGQGQRSRGLRSKVVGHYQRSRSPGQKKTHFKLFHIVFDISYLEVKVASVKVMGHVGQGQRSYWSRSNKDFKGRQVGSQVKHNNVKLLH